MCTCFQWSWNEVKQLLFCSASSVKTLGGRVTQGKKCKNTCVFGYSSLAHNATHLLQKTPRNAITDPHIHKSTHNHALRCNDCQGGQGESKQGQISSDSEGHQLHSLISLHFPFLLLNFYLICGRSPPRIPSQPPYVPLCLSPDFCNLSSSQHTNLHYTVKRDWPICRPSRWKPNSGGDTRSFLHLINWPTVYS